MQNKIKHDIQQARKDKNKSVLAALQMISGEMARSSAKQLADQEVINIIKKLHKSEKERQSFLAEISADDKIYLEVLEQYLPKQVGEDIVKSWIDNNINFEDYNNKMQAMKPIMQHFGDTVQGSIVKDILNNM